MQTSSCFKMISIMIFKLIFTIYTENVNFYVNQITSRHGIPYFFFFNKIFNEYYLFICLDLGYARSLLQ